MSTEKVKEHYINLEDPKAKRIKTSEKSFKENISDKNYEHQKF